MNQKDIKLLWGRAANRCALCRIELSQDAEGTPVSYILGEQAHIIGEKEDAPRGKSVLSIEERNCYHNIILLCPTDHTEIDKNEADWPIERLYQKKSKHELWVRETLSDSADIFEVAKQVAVTTIIDAAVNLCELENWKVWTSWAFSSDPQWSVDLLQKIFEFRQKVSTTIWPAEYEELKRATTTFAVVLHMASQKFMEHARREDRQYRPEKFYKVGFNPNYESDLALYEAWLQECYDLLKQATCAANWFSDVVRRDINPMFFAERGKFSIKEGLFEDFSFYVSVPEYAEEEKACLPQKLFSSSA